MCFDEYGCHRCTICSALKNAGVIVSSNATTRDADLTENVLRLHNNNIRVVDIGKKLGISESTVRRILRENGV
jgi:predicted transcriptional regulator